MARPDWQALGDALGPQPAGYIDGSPHKAPAVRHPGRETYRQREARLLGAGLHPRTGLPLANNGETCGSCRHRVVSPHLTAGTYWKCDLTRRSWTQGRATDCLARWPACSKWEPRQQEQGE